MLFTSRPFMPCVFDSEYVIRICVCCFFFSSRRRHTRCLSDWSSDVCSSDLGAGMDPAQAGKITGTLDSQGIAYKLGNGGTSIQVPTGAVSRARVAIAGAGLSVTGADNSGWAQFDKQKLGSSNFQQQVAYQRALETQIAQTIGQVDGVSGATVQLTMPQEQLFADQQKPATASVLLGGGPSTLEPGAVRGIANLVASAVPNLKASS